MAKILIPDKQELQEILQKAKRYDSIFDLAKAHGLRLDELEQGIRFHDLEYPVFLTERELTIKQDFPRLHAQGLSLKQIAHQFDIEPHELRYLVDKLHLVVFNPYLKSRDASLEVKHFIETRGGSIRAAMDALGCDRKHYNRVTSDLREMGFEVDRYRHVGKRYGSWLVLAARDDTSSKHHYCRCLNCGTEHHVLRENLRNGSTTQCQDCARNNRSIVRCPVRNVRTGEIFSSVAAAHKTIQGHINLGVFYRKLRRSQYVVLSDGTRFEYVLSQFDANRDSHYDRFFYDSVAPSIPPMDLAAPLKDMEDIVHHVPEQQTND